MRNIGTAPYAHGVHYDAISRWQRADMESTGMVYSSRSGRPPRRRTFEVTAARLACDAHRIRCTVECRGRCVVACSRG
jgi:hypothetical protein